MEGRSLGEFLRAQRLRAEADTVRCDRRQSGLRREDVAARAGISTGYYARIEQGRHPHPSADVLARLAAALDLGPAARARLGELAAQPLVEPTPAPLVLERALEVFDHVPAMVADRSLRIGRANRRWEGLFAHFTADDLARLVFVDHAADAFFVDRAAIGAEIVGELRRAASDPEVAAAVCALREESARFDDLWRRPPRGMARTHLVRHATLGELRFARVRFALPDLPGWHLHALVPPRDEESARMTPLLDLM